MKKSDKQLFFSMTYEYLEIYMRTQMLRSPATIESYRDALTVFRHYLRDELHLFVDSFGFSDCTRDLVMGFMEYLSHKGSKPGTRNQRLTVIKSYLWFAAEKDITLQSVAISVSRVKSCRDPKKEKPILDDEAVQLLLDAPPDTRTGIRDKTLMILLYDSAARLDEILSLQLCDVFLTSAAPCIRVVGKGQKERVIAITERTAGHLKQYLSVYHVKGVEDTDFLFYTVIKGQCGKMSEANVERFLKKYAEQVRKEYPDIPAHVHPHMFRRTRATGLYRDGVDLAIVSRFLGHAQLETTRIYATPSVEMMRAAIAKMPSGSPNEEALWDTDADAVIAKLCGLR